MCGIVAYVGHREASAIVIDGLRRLEYRGYDSAGIAVYDGDQIELRRSVGKLDNLTAVVAKSPCNGNTGIGHTRWATHGRPSEVNAHPHTDCHGDTVVIHNGIVENYLDLRERLLAEGHHFKSETDTEVIVHLVERYLDAGSDLESATRQALAEIRGAHAVVVMSRREPGKLVTARLGHAGGVVLGVGQDEMFVASDQPAILMHTKKMVFLNDREVAVVTKNGFTASTLEGEPVEKKITIVNLDPISAEKAGYKHFMLKEIHEQPSSLTDALRGRLLLDRGAVNIQELELADADLARVERIVAVACGTALHACIVGKFLIEQIARVPVEVDYASEFRYRDHLLDDRMLCLAVTQSGETVDTLVSMEAAKSKGVKVVGIVNVVGSQASQVADGVVYTHAGMEIGVASTKAFTSQLAALYLFAVHLGRVRGTLSPERARELMTDVATIPESVGRMLQDTSQYERLARHLQQARDVLYLGRGINYPIALEGALKLKEISYIHAEGYPAGEMKHGPIALIDSNLPVVAIAVRDAVYDKMISNIQQVKARQGKVIAIATEGDVDITTKTEVDHVIYVPACPPLLTPIIAAIPMQLIAYYTAAVLGCDVDQPRNLAKSVTVE